MRKADDSTIKRIVYIEDDSLPSLTVSVSVAVSVSLNICLSVSLYLSLSLSLFLSFSLSLVLFRRVSADFAEFLIR